VWPHLQEAAEAVTGRHAAVIDSYYVAAVGGPDAPTGSQVVLDPELSLHHRYGADRECLYLLRPDGYVAYRSQPAVAAGLREYLQRVLG
jgi:hypothetical protein